MDDVGLYGAERFVSDHDEDLLLLLQVNEVAEPRLLSQSGGDGLRLDLKLAQCRRELCFCTTCI